MPADGSNDDWTLRRVISSDPVAVRDALVALLDTLALRSLSDDRRGTVEIVLAEALNNIVEHAYAAAPGDIEVTLHLSRSGLHCTIADRGAPMPGGELPAGAFNDLGTGDDLPEGGFGWYLIRSLSRDLRYRRKQGRNLLTFWLNTKQ